jgi:hypothetical protein
MTNDGQYRNGRVESQNVTTTPKWVDVRADCHLQLEFQLVLALVMFGNIQSMGRMRAKFKLDKAYRRNNAMTTDSERLIWTRSAYLYLWVVIQIRVVRLFRVGHGTVVS